MNSPKAPSETPERPIESLARAIQDHSEPDTEREALPGLVLYHRTRSVQPLHAVAKPCLCVIAQGAKEVWINDEHYHYDPAHYLLISMQLPIVSQIAEASPETPYLSVRMDLDPALVASVMVEAGEVTPQNCDSVLGLDTSILERGLFDAILRLVRLIDSPLEARMLSPLIQREIVFRLLMGQQGARLRQISVLGGQSHKIAQAVHRLSTDFDKPIRVEEMARELGMSVSGFHHHFKSVTSMSPIQYQKQIRLQEARRLMLSDGLDAASAGYKVGYENPSHFSREYKRAFGDPPARDVERLRSNAAS